MGLEVVDGHAGLAHTASVPASNATAISAAATMRRIVMDCRNEIATQRAAVLATGDPSSIHDIRVALRRLRAAIGVFRPVVGDQREVQLIDSEAQRLARAVGPARDLQVFLLETAPDAPSRIARIGEKLVKRRVGTARAVLSGARFARFEQRLAQFAAGCPDVGGEPLQVFARHVLDRCADKVRRRGRRLAHLRVRELHRLRIASKKLRYAVGFLGSAFRPDATKAYGETAVELQDALGSMNDRAVSGQVLADIAQERRSSRKVKKSCGRLAMRLVHPSKGQRKRLKRAWKAFKKSEPFWR